MGTLTTVLEIKGNKLSDKFFSLVIQVIGIF